MKKALASAGLVAFGALSYQNADAQNSTAQLIAGDSKPYSLAGTLRGFYDDNYNTAPAGPDRRSSFGFEVKPSIGLTLNLPQTTVKASYFFDMRYYEDRPEHKADFSHDFELLVRHRISDRFSLDASDSFVIAQEPELLNPSDLSAKTRVNGNNLRNSAAVNLTAKANEELSFIVGYANTLYDYQQDYGRLTAADKAAGLVSRSGALDRMEQTATLTARYVVNRETTAVLGYQFGDVAYSSAETIGSQGGVPFTSKIRNNNSHYAFTGLDHYFTQELSGSLRVGVQYTDYYNDPSASSSFGPYVDISSTWHYREDGSVMLGFTHRRNQTDLVGNSLNQVTSLSNLTLDQESSTFYANISQKITPKLTGTLSGQYQSSDFKGGLTGNDTEQFVLLGLNLTYQFNRFLTGELGYNYDNLASDLSQRSFDRNRVYLGLTASY